jgi:hypothetical protein
MENKWTESVKKNALIVNTYRRKIEHARKEKQEATMYDELEREDLEPILANALNMVKSNIPAGMKAPKDTDELLIMFAESGLGDTFGIRDSEMKDMMGENIEQNPNGEMTLEQLMEMSKQQSIVSPIPQGYSQQPRNIGRKPSPQGTFPKSPMTGGVN